MSDKMIEADIEAEMRSIWNETGKKDFHPVQRHLAYCELLEKLKCELKRCYKREDELIEALKIIRDDLDDALETQGYNTLAHEKSEKTLQKIRNFANDASQ